MTDDVFSGKDPAQQTPQIDPDKSYVEQLVGEGKKFKDAEALARGKLESDTYIETLLAKIDSVSTELEKRMTAEEIADQIRSQMQPNPSNQQELPNPDGENGQGNQNQNNKPNFTTDDIEALLEKKLEEKSAVSRKQANIDEVNKTLRDKIGVTANQVLADKATEMGVTLEYLKEQAAISPKAFYNMINLNPQQTQGTGFVPPDSSVTTPPSGTTVRNKAYYDKMYRENPKLRMDAKTTVQEHKDMQRLGVEFFN